MSTIAIFTALSFFSSAALYLLHRNIAIHPDVHSAWLSWFLLLVVCLTMRKKHTSAQKQQYELLETGSPRLPDPVQRASNGVFMATLPAVAVAAGVLANMEATRFWLVRIASKSRRTLFLTSEKACSCCCQLNLAIPGKIWSVKTYPFGATTY